MKKIILTIFDFVFLLVGKSSQTILSITTFNSFYKSIFPIVAMQKLKLSVKMMTLLFSILISLFVNSAFGQIAQRGTATTANTTGTSLVIAAPAGITAGDVMIVNIAQRGSAALSNPTSSGWTLVAGTSLNGIVSPYSWGAVLYKVAGASEPANYTFALDADATSSAGVIVAFLGVDVSGATPFDVAPVAILVSGNSTLVTATPITTVTANAAVIMFGHAANSSPTWSSWTTTSPGNLTELYDNQGTASTVGAAWGILVTAGSTGNGYALLSTSQRNGGILIALKAISGPPTITSFTPLIGCANSTPVVITGTNFFGATSVTFGGTNASSFIVNSNTQITVIPAAGTDGTIEVITLGGAATSVDSFTINPSPSSPTIVSPINPMCIDGATSINLNATSDDGNTINWYTAATGGGSIGTSASGVDFPITPINTTTYYAESVDITGCPSVPRTATAIIIKIAIITVQPVAPPAFCAGSGNKTISVTATGATTYQWMRNGVDISDGVQYSGTTTATLTLINPGMSENGADFSVKLNSASCPVTSDPTQALTVNDSPTVLATPATQTSCSGVSITPIEITNPNNIVGTTFSWTRSANANITGINDGTGSSITGTLNNTATTVQTITFTITATANGCTSTTTASVTVNPTPSITVQPVAPAAFCAGSGNKTISVTATGVTTYQWQKSTDGSSTWNNVSNGALYSGTTTATLTLINPSSGENGAVFKVILNSASCPVISNSTQALTVNDSPTVSATPATQTICSGAPITPIAITNPNNIAGTVFSWTRSVNANITGITNGTGSSITGTLTNTATTAQTITFTITATANGCISTTTSSVTVNPGVNITFTEGSDLNSQTIGICGAIGGGGQDDIDILSGYIAGSVLQWEYSSSSSGPWTIDPYTGTQFYVGSFRSTLGTYYFRLRQTANGCSGYSDVVAFTVNSGTPPASPSATGVARCNTGTLTLTASGCGGTYRWYNSQFGGTLLGSGASFTTPSISVTTTYYVSCTVSNCESPRTAVTASIVGAITVTSSATGTVCSGLAQNYVITSSDPTNYQWSRAVVAGVSNSAGSGTTNSITETLINTTADPVVVHYIIIAGSCSGTPFNYDVTVNVSPTVLATPSTQPICTGSAITPIEISNPNNIAGTVFSWTRSVNANITGITNGTGSSITGILTNTATTVQTITFTITATANGCSSTTTSSVTVNPTPSITVQPVTPAAFCAGSGNKTISVTATGVTTYQWQKSTDGGSTWNNVSNGALYSGTTTATLTLINPGSGENGAVFKVILNSASCPITSSPTQALTVNDTPTVSATPSTQTICSGAPITPIAITNPNNIAGTTFSWTRNNTANVTGIANSGTGSTISGSLNNTQATAQTTIFTITATANGCTSTTTSSVTVSPSTALNISFNQTADQNTQSIGICGQIGGGGLDENDVDIRTGGGIAGATYQWEYSSVSSTGPWTIDPYTGVEFYVGSFTSTPGHYYFRLRRTVSGCQVYSDVVDFTVAGTLPASPTGVGAVRCGNGTLTLMASGCTGTNATLDWYNAPLAGTSVGTGTSFTTTPSLSVTTTYYVSCSTGTSGNGTLCRSPRTAVTATIQSAALATPGIGTITQPTCALATGSVVINNLPATGAWTLTRAGTSSATLNSSGTSTTVSGLVAGTYTFTVSITGGCTSLPANVDINTQPTTPTAPTLSAGDINCTDFTADWTPSANATGYRFDVATDAAFTSILPAYNNVLLGSGVLTKNVTTVTSGLPFYIRVRAENSCGTSANSATLIITTATSGTAFSTTLVQPNCMLDKGTITVSETVIVPSDEYSFDDGATYQSSNVKSALAPGTYKVKVRNTDGCVTLSATVLLNASVATTYSAGVWSSGLPNVLKKAIFASSYTFSGNLTACSCQVNAAVNVTVDPGFSLVLENGLDVLGTGTLTFKNNASLVQINDDAVNTGSITYIRTTTPIRSTDYTYWSSPVSPQTLFNVSPQTDPNKFFARDAVANQWVQVSSATVMERGVGYIIRGPLTAPYTPTTFNTYTASFFGVPNNGLITLSPAVALGKNYLIGNPYPSAINAVAFLQANPFIGALYFWTHNTAITNNAYTTDDYATFNLTGGVGTGSPAPSGATGGANDAIPNGKIASGQGFFASAVGTIAENVYFKFNDSMRMIGGAVIDNSQFFKMETNTKTSSKTTSESSVEKHRIWLNFTNSEGAFKQTLVAYLAGATNGYDYQYDGLAFNANKYVNFYSVNLDKTLTIQGRALPFEITDQVPLGYKSTIAGVFEIGIAQVEGDLVNHPVFLEDKTTNTIHNLKNKPYSFSTTIGTFNDRFVLRYTHKSANTADLGIDKTNKLVLVSVKNHQAKINSFDQNIEKVIVYDLLGRQLYEKENINSNVFNFPDFSLTEQFLIVKTLLENGTWVESKVVF